MKNIKPDYYKEFQCVGGECPDNCCIGWEIDIDDITFDKYMTFTGEFGEKLRDNIVISEDGCRCFKLTDDERCPFLNDANLCEIILKSGENMLCDICSSHPRFHNCFGDICETGIGLSCIKAAQIILNKQESSTLLCEVTNEKAYEVDYNKDFFEYIYKIRGTFIQLMQNRNLPISQRITELLFTAEKIQYEIDNGNSPHGVKLADFTLSDEALDYNLYLKMLDKLSSLNIEWTERISKLTEDDISGAKQCILCHETVAEQLITYYIFRHFLSSVYDYDILSRIKFAVFCTELSFWLIEDKSDTQSFMEMVCKSACLVSKEIEYCSENIEMILDFSYNEQIMSSNNLAIMF